MICTLCASGFWGSCTAYAFWWCDGHNQDCDRYISMEDEYPSADRMVMEDEQAT